eukprot:CAMPEP_0177715016 /NCGR_PEP_ID=MMETSP0484_2-20121128/13761_1 /TAXON_ID=354590 /ORGANISM="Rhodomonas lens, Strain RHODO" /LENGTH=194 /DNA_ID=CAMNT_0019226971 /DNA_START=159 /DNA_END=744 /DNA_ORIENTATION=-
MCISSGNETMVGSECEPNHDSRATTRGWRVRAAPQLLRAQLPTHHAPFQTVACIRHVTPNASRSAALSHAHQLPNFPNPNPENVVATRDTTQEHRLLAEKTKAGAQAAARAAFRALTRLDSAPTALSSSRSPSPRVSGCGPSRSASRQRRTCAGGTSRKFVPHAPPTAFQSQPPPSPLTAPETSSSDAHPRPKP